MLLYRFGRDMSHFNVKLAHTLVHSLSIPCAAIGFFSIYDYHNLSNPPIPHLYSLHSWLGLLTIGSYLFQYVVGVFTWVKLHFFIFLLFIYEAFLEFRNVFLRFLVTLFWVKDSLEFRNMMVPIHASLGIIALMLAVGAAVSGLTQRAYEVLGWVKWFALCW